MTLLIGGSVESSRAGRARRGWHVPAALGFLVACTEPNAPDPSSPLGNWTYRFVASTAVSGQEIKCYEDGVVSFVREPSNDISGFSGVVHSNCVPVGFVSPRSGRVPVLDASVSQTSVAYRAEACVFTASIPSPSTGGAPTEGSGFVTCRNALTGTSDSTTTTGPLILAR